MGNKHTLEVQKSRKKHNIVEIRFHIPQEEKDNISAYAQSKGMSLTGYLKNLIATDMKSGLE